MAVKVREYRAADGALDVTGQSYGQVPLVAPVGANGLPSVSPMPGAPVADSTWRQFSNPGENTTATTTKAAGAAGVRHVLTHVVARIATATGLVSAARVSLNVRDGASGTGTLIFVAQLSFPNVVGELAADDLTNLNIVGTAATAMTVEFSGAGGLGTFESIFASGYDIS